MRCGARKHEKKLVIIVVMRSEILGFALDVAKSVARVAVGVLFGKKSFVLQGSYPFRVLYTNYTSYEQLFQRLF